MPRPANALARLLLAAALVGESAGCSIVQSELRCGSLPADGPLTLVDEQQQEVTVYLLREAEGAKLCKDQRCKKCLAPAGSWAPCRKVKLWPVHASRTGKLALAAVLVTAASALVLSLKPRGKSFGAAMLDLAESMLRFAAQPWFPWIAAAGTAINMFTIVFTAATVVVFLAAVLGRPRSWRATALANAIGATVGSALLLLLLRSQGLEMIEQRFPTVFHSAAWAKTMRIMEGYGAMGMVGVASLPLILHPIIAFGVISGMSDMRILSIILLGRTIKYLTMAYITTTAPYLLKYFGIKEALFEIAKAGTAAKKE